MDVIAQVELMWGDEVVITTVNNLSLGGAFLLHDGDDVNVGETVSVHLSTETVDVVQQAKIVRVVKSEPRGFAVSWIEPRARTYAIIERLMRYEAPPVPVPAPPPPLSQTPIAAAKTPVKKPPPVKASRSKGKKRNKSADINRP
jgi:hypothetical protein